MAIGQSIRKTDAAVGSLYLPSAGGSEKASKFIQF